MFSTTRIRFLFGNQFLCEARDFQFLQTLVKKFRDGSLSYHRDILAENYQNRISLGAIKSATVPRNHCWKLGVWLPISAGRCDDFTRIVTARIVSQHEMKT